MLSSSSVVIAVLSAVLVLQVAEGQFNRRCQYPSDCNFETPATRNAPPFQMECRRNTCQCKSVPIADAPNWKLQSTGGKCLVDEGGPCGSDRGLNIQCSSGFSCVGSRCRSPSSVGKGKDGEYCKDDVDCLPTLRCAVVKFYFQAVRNCKPKNFVDNYSRSR